MAKKAKLWMAAAAAAVLLAICGANLTPNMSNQFLQAHNDARAAVGVLPLRWSENLASYASKLAVHPPGEATCELSQKANSTPYGANQAVTKFFDSTATVVGSWVNVGLRSYNYDNNSCAAGYKDECRSYTQVVWRKTAELGCGKSGCGKDGSHTICLYDPRGNIHGEKPY